MAQIATFYAGAMTEARIIELGPIAERVGGLDLVLIGAERPRGDAPAHPGVPHPRHPVRRRPVAAARVRRRPEIRQLVDGAAYLFTNEYEAHLTEQKTGWSHGRDRSTGSTSGSSRAARTASTIHTQGRGRRSTCRWPGEVAQGRPDRRRRRLPRRLPHRPRRRPRTYGAAPSSARCSRPTSSRRSARRSTSSARSDFLERLTDAYGADAGRRDRAARRLPPATDRPRRRDGPPAVEPPVRLRLLDAARPSPGRTSSAVGADLEPGTLLAAYRARPVPDGPRRRTAAAPIGWWSPDPRGDPAPAGLQVSRSLRTVAATLRGARRHRLRRGGRRLRRPVAGGSLDHPRDRRGVQPAARAGLGAPVEVLAGRRLVGGLYGVAIGGLFAGESMFHTATDASKAALVGLVERRGRRRRPAPARRRAVAHRPPGDARASGGAARPRTCGCWPTP